MSPTQAESLSSIKIFKGLTEDTLEEFGRRCRWRRYAPDQQIVGHLDDTRDVFFLVEGEVRVINYSLAGKAVTFADIEAGQVFGEYAAIDGEPRSANVMSLTDSLIASLSADAFWSLLQNHPEVPAALLRKLTGQLREMSQRVFEFSTMAVKNRIHAELLRLCRHHMDGERTATITPAPTHAEIASRISTHREAVTRELSALARAGLISHPRGALVVADVDRLEQMVHEVIGE